MVRPAPEVAHYHPASAMPFCVIYVGSSCHYNYKLRYLKEALWVLVTVHLHGIVYLTI
jgi:hypothetical protein